VSALEKNPSVVRVDLNFGSWRVGEYDYKYPKIAIHFVNPAAPDSAKWRNGGWVSKVLPGLFSKSVLQAPSLPAPARNREIISKLQAAKDKVEETIVQINNLDFDMDPIKLSVKRIEAAVDARYVSYAPISHAIHNMNATADVIKEYIDIERHCGVAEAKVDLPEKSKEDVQRLLHTLTKSLGETADKALEPMMVRAQIGAAVMQETMERRLTRD
jgi:hypothetical protein